MLALMDIVFDEHLNLSLKVSGKKLSYNRIGV